MNNITFEPCNVSHTLYIMENKISNVWNHQAANHQIPNSRLHQASKLTRKVTTTHTSRPRRFLSPACPIVGWSASKPRKRLVGFTCAEFHSWDSMIVPDFAWALSLYRYLFPKRLSIAQQSPAKKNHHAKRVSLKRTKRKTECRKWSPVLNQAVGWMRRQLHDVVTCGTTWFPMCIHKSSGSSSLPKKKNAGVPQFYPNIS